MGRALQLALFRRIMRLHQRKLPDIHRAVGDRYVRQEFRSMGEGGGKQPTAQQEAQFMQLWVEYAQHLEVDADLFGIGRDMSDDDIDSMSDEQAHQLSKIEQSVRDINKGDT